jgi:hypothetical protein
MNLATRRDKKSKSILLDLSGAAIADQRHQQ